jgi:membrane-associated protease RseP (regulator of RpoE activity)
VNPFQEPLGAPRSVFLWMVFFMVRCLAVMILLTVGLVPLCAQPNNQSPPEEARGTYLGVLFSPVPEAVYAQVPVLSHDFGVLVNFLLPESPAVVAGLQRYDILLKYNGEKIKDCEHFARLIRNDKPENNVELLYLRGGKEQSVTAKLVLGPALTHRELDSKTDVPKAASKPAPGGVSLAVKPLGDNKVNVLIEYLDETTKQLRSVQCTDRKLDEVEADIKNLPDRLQKPALKAWNQVRGKIEEKTEPKANAPSDK